MWSPVVKLSSSHCKISSELFVFAHARYPAMWVLSHVSPAWIVWASVSVPNECMSSARSGTTKLTVGKAENPAVVVGNAVKSWIVLAGTLENHRYGTCRPANGLGPQEVRDAGWFSA